MIANWQNDQHPCNLVRIPLCPLNLLYPSDNGCQWRSVQSRTIMIHASLPPCRWYTRQAVSGAYR